MQARYQSTLALTFETHFPSLWQCYSLAAVDADVRVSKACNAEKGIPLVLGIELQLLTDSSTGWMDLKK